MKSNDEGSMEKRCDGLGTVKPRRQPSESGASRCPLRDIVGWELSDEWSGGLRIENKMI